MTPLFYPSYNLIFGASFQYDKLSKDIDRAKADMLKAQVEKELAIQARSNEQKAVLRKALGQVVQTKILPSPLCENNQFNPNYTTYRNLAAEIINEKLKDL